MDARGFQDGYGQQRQDRYAGRSTAIVPADATMPHDRAAEASVLSAMILSQDVLTECFTELTDQDFYIPSHRRIFEAIHTLFDRGAPSDPISLADYLNSQGELERVGGRSYLLDLGGDTFALASWRSHIEIIKRDTTLRKLIEASAAITALAFDAPEDTREVVNMAESRLFDVTQEAVDNKYERLEEVLLRLYTELGEMSKSGQTPGVNTGFPRIDRSLLGMRPGQMIVIGARPGVGKTSFALNLAVNVAASGATVALFSLEMSANEVGQRLLSSQAKIDLSVIRGGRVRDNQWNEIIEATSELSKLDLLIDDNPDTTITEIRAKARRMLHGKQNALVIIDYLQLVSPPSGGRRADSRATEVSEMSRGIKIMAKDLGIPVIALSQLNRQVADRKGQRPQLSDLRESGSIEQDADVVMLLDRSMTQEEAERTDRPDWGMTDVIIAKNRSGPLDIVPLGFVASRTKFYEVDTHHEA